MIYLLYLEDADGHIDIQRCRDELHYLDMLVEVESRAVIVPYDIRFHGETGLPALRVLALSPNHTNFSAVSREIIDICILWLRQN